MNSIPKKIIGFAIFASLFLLSCDAPRSTQPFEHTELAMSPGMVIEAKNKYGSIRITAVDELVRRYQWDDFDESRTLIPRKERFMGELGAYDPASSPVWEFWHQRIVARDSQLNFGSLEELKARYTRVTP